ncbi:MAG: hypothetical protein RIR77_1370 [Planctomycetota bacterium]|jgi:uncharacterized protein YcfL
MIQTTNVTTNDPCALRALRVTPAVTFITAALLAVGCGSVNTTYTRTTPADSAVSAQTRVNDLFQEFFLTAKEVRMNRTKGGPMEVQIDVENNGFAYKTFSYRFDWVDTAGNVIASQLSVWKVSNVPSGGSTVIRAVAPSDDATDFRLQLRQSES